MTFADYKRSVAQTGNDDDVVSLVLDQYFHTGQSRCFDGAPHGEEASLKKSVATGLVRDLLERNGLNLMIHPLELVLCGSAHLGFSPVPSKLGKPFNPETSDIDIAIVHAELFDRWWAELQTLEQLLPGRQEAVFESVFRGYIDPSLVSESSRIGKTWWNYFGGIETYRANGIRGRLYRNHWSMESYHRHAIQEARRKCTDRA